MGFTSFGEQNSKRKFKSNDGFIDPSIAQPRAKETFDEPPIHSRKTPHAHGANAVQLNSSRAASSKNVDATVSNIPSGHQNAGEPSLEAFRYGVKNSRGDIAYFKPSFLEDPWKNLPSVNK